MHIDDNLNLVFPIRIESHSEEKGDRKTDRDVPVVYAFHTPITREVFEANFRILSLAKAQIYGKGLPFAMGTGPLVASLVLKEEARRDAEERDLPNPDQASKALLLELKRLTMIVGPSPEGFKPLPVDAAISAGVIDPEEWEEAESMLVFFTATSSLVRRAKKREVMESAAFILGGSTTSSTCTEWAAFLRTSTPVDPGALIPTLSVKL